MPIDFRLIDGLRSGMTFDFVPSFQRDYLSEPAFKARKGPGTFSISENAYLFVEMAVAKAWPEYGPYHHWGISWIPAGVWVDILDGLAGLRFDIRSGIHPKRLEKKHVRYRGCFTRPGRLNRKALLDFLDAFEARVRRVISVYPYLAIGGL